MASRTEWNGFRHGQAHKAQEKGTLAELRRELTVLGRMQGKDLAKAFEGVTVDMVLNSVAVRSIQTTELALPFPRTDFKTVRQLYRVDGPVGDTIDRIYDEIGAASARTYAAHAYSSGEVEEYCRVAGQALWRATNLYATKPDCIIAVPGHSMLTPLAVLGAAKEMMDDSLPELQEFLLDLDLKCGQGFQVICDTNGSGSVTFKMLN